MARVANQILRSPCLLFWSNPLVHTLPPPFQPNPRASTIATQAWRVRPYPTRALAIATGSRAPIAMERARTPSTPTRDRRLERRTLLQVPSACLWRCSLPAHHVHIQSPIYDREQMARSAVPTASFPRVARLLLLLLLSAVGLCAARPAAAAATAAASASAAAAASDVDAVTWHASRALLQVCQPPSFLFEVHL